MEQDILKNKKIWFRNIFLFMCVLMVCIALVMLSIPMKTKGAESRYIYLDATYSQLRYEYKDPNNINYPGETHLYQNILPNYDNGVRRNVVCEDNQGNKYTMSVIKDDYSGELIYRTDQMIDNSIVSFRFYNENCASWNNSSRTDFQIIDDISHDCFVANTSEPDLYENRLRGGYWRTYGGVKDVETENNKTIVDIGIAAKSTSKNILWVNSTVYDYYSDYELNGLNRDTYSAGALANNNYNNHRRYASFRQFDQALSSYYSADGSPIYPMYTGHFQPDVAGFGCMYTEIADTLGLYGYQTLTSHPRDFFANNNSIYNYYADDSEAGRSNGNGGYYDFVTKGLVNDTLLNDLPVLTGGNLISPHFNKEFIEGENSKNAVIGKVYENVDFPFTQKKAFADVSTGVVEPVNYWWFDSASTTLYLKKNQADESEYFLSGNAYSKDWHSKNVNSTGATVDVSNTYGYFPFNDGVTANNSSYYNYGFGNKIDIDFRMTEDGKVLGEDGNYYDAKFRFSGDDDVWVFIDGKLVLDCGGAHGKVTGLINFAENKSYISKVKKGASCDMTYGPDSKDAEGRRLKATYRYTAGGENGDTVSVDDFYYEQGNVLETLADGTYDTTTKHTMTIFYMERGQWESNLSLCFNMVIEDELIVSKEVDVTTNEVNDLFKNYLENNNNFTFKLMNLATHFGQTEVGTTGQGFLINQASIPDYGSALSGNLENAAGSKYKSNLYEDGLINVDDNGEFTLKNNEIATFANQFRKGSYISVVEVLNEAQQALYDTKVKLLDHATEITSYYVEESTTISTVESGTPPFTGEIQTIKYNLAPELFIGPDDGRIERYLDEIATETGGMTGNAYSAGKVVGSIGIRPDTGLPVILFRSYDLPDSESSSTVIKAEYTNIAKTGGLSITKAESVAGELSGDYTFTIEFFNVGGLGLEGDETIPVQTVTLHVGETYDMSGIPVGTQYRIVESANDGSNIVKVTKNGVVEEFNAGSNEITGSISADDSSVAGGGLNAYVVTNGKNKITKIDVTKIWDDAENPDDRPSDGIYVALFRSTDKNANVSDWVKVSDYVNLNSLNEYKTEFNNLDVYDDYTSPDRRRYYYRIFEYTKNGSEYVLVDENNKITGYNLPVYSEVTVENDGNDDGIIDAIESENNGGSSGELVVTNKYNPVSYVLPEAGGSTKELMLLEGILIMWLGCLFNKKMKKEREKIYEEI